MFFLEIMGYLAFLKVLFQTSGMNIQNTLLDLYFIALYLSASRDFNVFLKAVFSKEINSTSAAPKMVKYITFLPCSSGVSCL